MSNIQIDPLLVITLCVAVSVEGGSIVHLQ